jgi:hypothetical protein
MSAVLSVLKKYWWQMPFHGSQVADESANLLGCWPQARFSVTNPTGELLTSGLPVTREECRRTGNLRCLSAPEDLSGCCIFRKTASIGHSINSINCELIAILPTSNRPEGKGEMGPSDS